ncbi:MAG: methionine synthase [Oscillospiraceae bacterium]|jgi:hypothetical protein|nr:methionine synthase [Oscillospiraceae bacterium]
MEKSKAEVLRYLGRRNQEVSPQLDSLIEECMLLMGEAAAPRHVRKTFGIQLRSDGIQVENSGLLLCGEDISRHLTGCGSVVLLAATLSVPADNLIRRWENADLTRSLVLDACAGQLIEQYLDEIEAQICHEAGETGLTVTSRFSPGYGDLPLDIQPKLLAVLDAGKKIGLTCTESLILLPRKSVTAILGLGKGVHDKPEGCEGCLLNKTCAFRKGENI